MIGRAAKGKQMSSYQCSPDHIVADEQALRGLFPPTHEMAIRKSITQLDTHARNFIARAPFVCVGTQNADGSADVSPRGDPAGFVQVLDDQTIAIPDRPGNNRLDTLANIASNPCVGLLFMVPGFDDTLRINGQAVLSTDPELLTRMAVQDRTPKIAIVVQISEIFMHCAKAFRRSRLWDPAELQNRSEMPSLMTIMMDQAGAPPRDDAEAQALDDRLEEGYKKSMY